MPNIFNCLEADVLGGRLPVCSIPRNEFKLISPGLNSLKRSSDSVRTYLCGGVSTSRGEESSEELSDDPSELLEMNMLLEGPGSVDSGSVFVFDSFFNLTFFNPAVSSSSNIFSSS